MNQFLMFMCSCGLGIGLGIFYDFFRILRLIINPKNIAIFVQDVIYFVFSGLLTFFFVLVFNFGEMRFYILGGECIGWIGYHLSLGDMVYKKTKNVVNKRRRSKSTTKF